MKQTLPGLWWKGHRRQSVGISDSVVGFLLLRTFPFAGDTSLWSHHPVTLNSLVLVYGVSRWGYGTVNQNQFSLPPPHLLCGSIYQHQTLGIYEWLTEPSWLPRCGGTHEDSPALQTPSPVSSQERRSSVERPSGCGRQQAGHLLLCGH